MREDSRGASGRRRGDSRSRTRHRPDSRPTRPVRAGSSPLPRAADVTAPGVDTASAVTFGPTAGSATSQTVDRSELTAAAADGAVRAALAVAVGLAGCVATGLILWAVTPGTDVGAETTVRAATAAYLLAHFGSVDIGGAALTMPPLLLTLIFGAALWLGSGRGRAGATATAEGAWIGAGSLTYAALVVLTAVTLAPPGMAVLDAGTGALFLAGAALGLGRLRRGAALRARLLNVVPGWAGTGVLAGAAAVLAVTGGAALVLAIALGLRLSTAADLASTLTAGAGDAVGLALAGLAYLPNAVLAAVGYVTGVGFQVGAGRWSPLGSVPGDLPPFPLLAAVPGSAGVSVPGLVTLLVPVAAAVVAALVVLRRTVGRRPRWAALGTAAGVAGVLGGALVWVGSGGVSGGPWPHIGARGWHVALALAVIVLVVGGAWVAAAGRSAAPVAEDEPAADEASAGTGAADPGDAADTRAGTAADAEPGTGIDTGTATAAGFGSDQRGDSAAARQATAEHAITEPAIAEPAITEEATSEPAITEEAATEQVTAVSAAASAPDDPGSADPDVDVRSGPSPDTPVR